MSVLIDLKENGNLVRHVSSSVLMGGLCITLLILILAGCNSGSYSSTSPSERTSKHEAGSVSGSGSIVSGPAHTTDGKLAYHFANDIVAAEWPGKENTCGLLPDNPKFPRNCETFYVGNPVNTYSIDLVSGLATSIGLTADLIPGNTKSLATSPSDNFLYMLTADKAGNGLVYTFSIGYLTLTMEEFRGNNLDPLALYNALAKDGYITGTVSSVNQVVDNLIGLIEEPVLYDRMFAKNPNLPETAEIKKLKAETVRTRAKLFGDLSYGEKKLIVKLNRLMLESAYPNLIPMNKGTSALHVVGPPMKGPLVSTYASLHVEPQGQFIYALSSSSSIYSTETLSYVPGSSLTVYTINPATGTLTPGGIQAIAIDQLIFAPSGNFAYGATNGTIHTYRIDRATGLFTGIGSNAFASWVVGNDFHSINKPPLWHQSPALHYMAADPSGKYLFVLGQHVQTYMRPVPYQGCVLPDVNSNGSLVYTFIIDKNTGLLTQSGPPLDLTPNTMTWGSVDPDGTFIQLLNTHELDPKWDECGPGVSAIFPGYIHSFYVDQNSGELIPSGSLTAGGTEIPTGFVNAGATPISLTGNDTGRFVYLLNQGNMFNYEVDQADGALTTVGSPLTGATETAIPGVDPNPIMWPNVCYLPDSACSVGGYRPHSITWAGY